MYDVQDGDMIEAPDNKIGFVVSTYSGGFDIMWSDDTVSRSIDLSTTHDLQPLMDNFWRFQ